MSTHLLLSRKTHIRKQPLASRLCSIRTAYPPSSNVGIPVRISDVFVIFNVFSEVPSFLYVLKIPLQFAEPGEPLREGKLLPNLPVEELVSRRVAVDAGPGV